MYAAPSAYAVNHHQQRHPGQPLPQGALPPTMPGPNHRLFNPNGLPADQVQQLQMQQMMYAQQQQQQQQQQLSTMPPGGQPVMMQPHGHYATEPAVGPITVCIAVLCFPWGLLACLCPCDRRQTWVDTMPMPQQMQLPAGGQQPPQPQQMQTTMHAPTAPPPPPPPPAPGQQPAASLSSV